MPHGLTRARAVRPYSPNPTDDAPYLNEATLLRAWDRDIRQAARAGSRRLQSAVVGADDLAQIARLQLLIAARRRGTMSDGYIRRLIRNAIISALRREVSRRGGEPGRLVEVTECLPAPSPEPPEVVAHVTNWITGLPHRLQFTYDALYVRRMTQRDAAQQLGVSQPRVSQLHAAILEHGRRTIVPAA